jgi:tartrate-resistant acid phosphatase type 5
MKKIFIAIMSALLINTSCRQGNSSSVKSGQDAQEKTIITDVTSFSGLDELEELPGATHFYVLGDWGRNGFENQQEVADAMHAASTVIEPEFIISTGDNFYPNGIASVHDPYWKSSFEDVYRGNALFCPWYVALGNHDYRGNVDAQIEYSNISKRWTMPARYFSIDKVLEDDVTTARFVFVDTNPLEDDYYEEGSKYQRAVQSQDTIAQLNWLEEQLARNPHHWTIVIGHHPMYTSGKRVDDEPYVRKHLEPILERHTVHATFAGHEHDLQHQKPEGVFTHHFVSGAGSEVRPTGERDYTQFAKSIAGFMIVSLTKDAMLVQAVDYMGNVVYKTKIPHALNESVLSN